ncbi:hypothetical protein L0666_00115 [Octadecabacter sp. CECT 8868]|uniref:hypothetical protein n=1 Tax=Octadecabacter TaxID=53945 RepID=UPI001C08264D|nr:MULTISPECIES: hypothetical protein [Octadecabacter]MBU2994098.1 hypothetical protein [Octadecabacter sp. B2R22]MCF2903377.1 hypothetical protein [Octadecabacter algicola]
MPNDKTVEFDSLVLSKLARTLYGRQSQGAFDKDAWEAARPEFRKQARALLRSLDKQGLKLVSAE